MDGGRRELEEDPERWRMTTHALQTTGGSELADPQWMRPQTMQEAMQFAELVANSDMVPNDHRRKPGNIMVCMQISQSLDVPLLTVMQNVAVINGRPSIWGDFALALAQRHPDFQDIEETWEGEGERRTAICTVKRRGKTPTVRTFSVQDATRAKLWGKAGPWQQYPDRMLQMRARGFALRDAFADALKGLSIAEEVRDIDATEVRVVETPSRGVAALAERVAPKPAEIEAQPEPAVVSARQRGMAALREAGINDRDAMTGYVEKIVGREVSPDNPLTDAEWEQVAEAAEEDAARMAEASDV